VAVGLHTISDAMIDAGLEALADVIPASRDPLAPLMPALEDVSAVAEAVARAVALVGVRDHQCRLANSPEQALTRLEQARWQPRYTELRATARPSAP
jgi:malic enzyme